MYDENGLVISGTTQVNMTMGASETKQFSKLRVKNTATQTAFRVFGFYLDLPQGSNITTVAINDNKDGAQGSMPLVRTTNDDFNWKLNTPVVLYQYDFLDISGITFTADADGPVNEGYTMYVVDGEYFYSSQSKGVLFGAETDAASPADVGAADVTIAGYIV